MSANNLHLTVQLLGTLSCICWKRGVQNIYAMCIVEFKSCGRSTAPVGSVLKVSSLCAILSSHFVDFRLNYHKPMSFFRKLKIWREHLDYKMLRLKKPQHILVLFAKNLLTTIHISANICCENTHFLKNCCI